MYETDRVIKLPVTKLKVSDEVRECYTPAELMRLAGFFMAAETTELVIEDGVHKLGMSLDTTSGVLSIFTVRVSYSIYEELSDDDLVSDRYHGALTMHSLGTQPQTGQFWVVLVGQSSGATAAECLRNVEDSGLLRLSGGQLARAENPW